MGLLDLSPLLSQIQQFGPTDSERADARNAGLLAAGFALMGARKGYEGDALSKAGLLGMQTYQERLAQERQAQSQRMQEAASAISLQNALRQMQEYQTAQNVIRSQFGGGMGQDSQAPGSASPAPATPAGGAFPMTPGGASGAFNAAAGFPTASNSGQGLPTAAGTIGGAAFGPKPTQVALNTGNGFNRRALAQQYFRTAQALFHAGALDQAAQWQQRAMQMMPQLKSQEVRIDPATGQRAVVNVYTDGSEEVQHDVQPEPLPLNFQNSGDRIVGLNPQTGAVASQGVPVNMNPFQQTSAAQRAQELAETAIRDRQANARAYAEIGAANQRSANEIAAGNERAAAQRALTASGVQIVPNQLTGDVYAVNTHSGAASPVMAGGQQLNTGARPLTESQGKATLFANQMVTASNKLAQLAKQGYDGSTIFGQTENALANPVPDSAHFSGIRNAVGNMFASSKAQEYMQAAHQWIEGMLRFQSGATITPNELQEAFKTYFPQPNDSATVVRQKAAMRHQAELNMHAAAGPQGSTQILPYGNGAKVVPFTDLLNSTGASPR